MFIALSCGILFSENENVFTIPLSLPSARWKIPLFSSCTLLPLNIPLSITVANTTRYDSVGSSGSGGTIAEFAKFVISCVVTNPPFPGFLSFGADLGYDIVAIEKFNVAFPPESRNCWFIVGATKLFISLLRNTLKLILDLGGLPPVKFSRNHFPNASILIGISAIE